jgi:hypothetical protein
MAQRRKSKMISKGSALELGLVVTIVVGAVAVAMRFSAVEKDVETLNRDIGRIEAAHKDDEAANKDHGSRIQKLESNYEHIIQALKDLKEAVSGRSPAKPRP